MLCPFGSQGGSLRKGEVFACGGRSQNRKDLEDTYVRRNHDLKDFKVPVSAYYDVVLGDE